MPTTPAQDNSFKRSRMYLVDAADRPALSPRDTRSRGGGASLWPATQFMLKRSVDITASLILLVLLSPLMLLISIAIWVTSPGPVIYSSRRIGLGGKEFGCLKFRSMRKGADLLQPQLEDMNEAAGAVFKMQKDPRVTSVGRWLRSSGLDEVPQLLNVLFGSMSLVGPRPLPLRDCGLLPPNAWYRHCVLPGISGPWQLAPDRHVDSDLLGRMDLEYVEKWSLWIDIRVICATVWYAITRLLTTDSELAAGGGS